MKKFGFKKNSIYEIWNDMYMYILLHSLNTPPQISKLKN